MKKLMMNILALLAICAVTPALGMKRKNEFSDKENVKRQKTGLLHRAVFGGDARYVDVLLELIEVNSRDGMGRTALHYASYKGAVEVVKALFRKPDIDVNLQDKNGITALHSACSRGNIEVVRILLGSKGINVNLKDNDGKTAIERTSKNKQTEILNIFQAQKRIQDSLNKDLLDAVMDNDVVKLKKALRNGADVNCRDDEMRTPLHYSLHPGEEDNPHVVTISSDGRAYVRARPRGESPRFNCLKLLLEQKNIQVNLQDSEGNTPLYYAAQHDELIEDLRLLLARSDTDLSLKNYDGETVLNFTAGWYSSDAVKELLLYKVEKETDASQRLINVNSCDKYGKTPLHNAIGSNSYDNAEILIGQKIVNINLGDNSGNTPLHYSANYPGKKGLKLLFTRNDLNLNQQNNDKDTPLHLAFVNNKAYSLASLLARQGINIDLKNNQNKSVCDLAREANYSPVKFIFDYFIAMRKDNLRSLNQVNELVQDFIDKDHKGLVQEGLSVWLNVLFNANKIAQLDCFYKVAKHNNESKKALAALLECDIDSLGTYKDYRRLLSKKALLVGNSFYSNHNFKENVLVALNKKKFTDIKIKFN